MIKLVTKFNNLSSDQWREVQNLMDESGMFDEREKAREFASEENGRFALCAVDELGDVYAFGFLEDQGSELYLSHLYVEVRMRKKGVAARILDKAKEVARNQGFSRLGLAVGKDNEGAISLYRGKGFTEQREYNGKKIMTASTLDLKQEPSNVK